MLLYELGELLDAVLAEQFLDFCLLACFEFLGEQDLDFCLSYVGSRRFLLVFTEGELLSGLV